MFNYANLSDVEFENLCMDVMQEMLGIPLRSYAKGKDHGIDISDESGRVIIQVKHYVNSQLSQLLRAIRREYPKVQKLAPEKYYICCSLELSRDRLDEIQKLFSGWMDSQAHIITVSIIDRFLKDPAHADILKKHYKLWLDSLNILQLISNPRKFIDCETLLSNIEAERKLFVATSAFAEAQKSLEEKKTLFIIGHPGVGKSMTSKMLVLHFATRGYRVRFSADSSDVKGIKDSLSLDRDAKEIILVDDCLGQAYFRIQENRSTELRSLINYVNASANKLLILNSRVTILNEATERDTELLECLERKNSIYVLNMDRLSPLEKARIFYNHIYFNGMDAEYFAEFKKEKRYLDIIRHKNYTPRIIEFICKRKQYQAQEPSGYYEFAMKQLNDPQKIWRNEYDKRLDEVDRLLLLTLYSLSAYTVEESIVKACFEYRLSCERKVDTTFNQYDAVLARLLDGFVKIVSERGARKLSMVNPSVNDFLDNMLQDNLPEKRKIIKHACSIQQMRRMLSSAEFDAFVEEALRAHEIDNYMFEDDRQKDALVTLYVGTCNIMDEVYAPCIQRYLDAPSSLLLYGRSAYKPAEIFREIFQDELMSYYHLLDYISNREALRRILDGDDIDDILCTIELLDEYFAGPRRSMFVAVAIQQLRCAIKYYCYNLNANEFFVDIDEAVRKARYDDDDEVRSGFDMDEAVLYIEAEIREEAERDIRSKLWMLAHDIREWERYSDCLSCCFITGAEEMLESYLAGPPKRYGGAGLDEDEQEQIDRMFNRLHPSSASAEEAEV